MAEARRLLFSLHPSLPEGNFPRARERANGGAADRPTATASIMERE